jgi:hypothetical protein
MGLCDERMLAYEMENNISNQSEQQKLSDNRRTGALPSKHKAKYQKPAFRFEKVFEASALACGKIDTTQPTCLFNRKTS